MWHNNATFGLTGRVRQHSRQDRIKTGYHKLMIRLGLTALGTLGHELDSVSRWHGPCIVYSSYDGTRE
jgi:hypothetical protein